MAKILNRDLVVGGKISILVNGVPTEVVNSAGQVSGTLIIPAGGISAAGLANNAVETAKIKDANVTKAKLAPTLVSEFRVVAAGVADLPNNAATSDVTLSGLEASDIVLVTPSVMGTKSTTLQALYKSATAITITSSANTATGDKAFYVVLRATT